MRSSISVFLLGLGIFAIAVVGGVDAASGSVYSMVCDPLLLPSVTCLGIVALRKMPVIYAIVYSTLIFILNEVLVLIDKGDKYGQEGHGFLFVSLMAGLLLNILCLLIYTGVKYWKERHSLWINLGLILLYTVINPALCLVLMKGNLD